MRRIAIDIGDVLCTVDLSIFLEQLVASGHADSQEKALLYVEELQPLQDLGLVTMGQWLRDRFALLDGSEGPLVEAWNKILFPNRRMTKFVQQLKNEGVEIALLSNIGRDHSAVVRKHPTVGNLYNSCIQHFSCEVGARKPSKLYFQSFLLEHPGFENCIYLDDRPENIQVANKLGIRGVHFCLEPLKESGKLEDKLNLIYKMLPNNYTAETLFAETRKHA